MRALASRAAAALAVVIAMAAASQAAPGYNRYPALHDQRVVFCAEGDLWIAADSGGPARRVTAHPGTESFPAFSPDGKTIAFTGEYDGNRDVFVVPAGGGAPRRLTWHPASDEVVGWTPDGTRVLFRSSRHDPNGTEIFAVPATGGDPAKLPIGWATRLAIDPASGAYAFNRKSWENATWKRYRGGTAPDIWVGHPDRKDFKLVTSFPGLNAYPMWHGGRVYFLSDQGGTANIWSIKPDGSDRRRHTSFTEWDVRWPSMGDDGRIVFTLGADLYVWDPKADAKKGDARKIDVDLPTDAPLTRVRYADPARFVTWFTLSPKADRVAIVARGEIFSVAVKDGVTLPVTRGSGARENWAAFDPKGKRIAYVSDAGREEDLRTVDAWGRGEPAIVKKAGTAGWHFPPAWSPDGALLAFADQTQGLFVVPAGGGEPKLVDRSAQAEIRQYAFSPDGRWLAYAKAHTNDYTSIFLYDTKAGTVTRVTGPSTNDFAPAWDPEGRYLYFLSDRATNPVLDSRDLQNIELKNTIPMLVLLKKDAKNPFLHAAGLPDDDADAKADAKAGDKKDGSKADGKDGDKKDGSKADGKDADKKGDGKDADKKDEKPKPVEIDLPGLEERVVALPNVDRGRFASLAATAKAVFLLSVPVHGMAEQPALFSEPEPDNTISVYDLEKKKLKTFLENVSAFELAAKADKMAVMKGPGNIFVVDAGPAPPDLADAKVSLAGVTLELDPRAEWEQMYYEAWRLSRDFFWDASMGGLDWKGLRDRYATLLPRLGTRDDLRDLVGELIGELNNSHTYTWGGDNPVRVPRWSTGLIGADVAREGDAYRITRIYRGDPADNQRTPLREPGALVDEGQYILAVNHRPFPKDRPFYAAFENLAEKDVVLTVNAKPALDGARDVVVRPLGDEEALRYADWTRRNREYVAQKTNGRVGYLHLPNMGAQGQIQFNTWFYPQLDKEALIVDNRWNGGGFVSQMILERLRRRVISFDRARGGGTSTYPYRTLNGPFVVLTNEFAGSDGDIFPAAVQLEKLAPVIGMRSWGGVVGIRADKPLVDGGMVTQPEFAWWDPAGGWSLENQGVVPDIEVQNAPQDVARGVDAQLDRGIDEVLKLHAQRPPIKPQFGPIRPRDRKSFETELAGM